MDLVKDILQGYNPQFDIGRIGRHNSTPLGVLLQRAVAEGLGDLISYGTSEAAGVFRDDQYRLTYYGATLTSRRVKIAEVEHSRFPNDALRYDQIRVWAGIPAEWKPIEENNGTHVRTIQYSRIGKVLSDIIERPGSDWNEINEMKSKMGNEPFKLDDSLLRDYPEMQALSGMPTKEVPPDTWRVSVAYMNLRTVERCLSNVEAGRQTIDIEYLLKLVRRSLDELAVTEKYGRFVAAERQKLDQLSNRASELIGDKVRGRDAVYR